MYCICCKKDNVIPLQHGEEMSEEDYIWSVEKEELTKEGQEYFGKKVRMDNVDSRMWDGGIVQIINAGYGSGHDTDQYVIAICDDCIDRETEEGTLLQYDNYMHPDSPYTKEVVDKSKQIYRRRKNLDRLV